jgi:hypothetical protein
MKQLHGLTRFDFNKNGQCDYILGFSGFHEPDSTSSSSLDLDPSYSSLPLDIARLLMIQATLLHEVHSIFAKTTTTRVPESCYYVPN